MYVCDHSISRAAVFSRCVCVCVCVCVRVRARARVCGMRAFMHSCARVAVCTCRHVRCPYKVYIFHVSRMRNP